MLKKLFKIGMLASLMMFACNLNAQSDQTETKNYFPVYPHYSFWSNWSIGGGPMLNWEGNHGKGLHFGETWSVGFGLFVEKELSYIWDLRFDGFVPGFFIKNDANSNYTAYDRYGKIGVDGKFSLNNALRGYYDPECKTNFYLVGGFGFSINYLKEEMGVIGEYFQGGLGYSYQCCEHSTLFIEYHQDIVADPPNIIRGAWHHTNGTLFFGYMYNFGPTATDLEIIAQRALLTQENFDLLNKEIDELKSDLRDAKTREAKLINRINELEAEQAATTIVKGDDALTDSLRHVIEGYENNKHNFYALPFSILYGVDQYTVSADQMKKIKAIAQVMKDNEDCDFEIIGYCDYSGSDSYNQKLSEKRAEYVKNLLVKKYGIDENRLTISGKGKSMSFGDIKNAVNRRVSFYRVNK